jgi:hypothetical protein
MKGTECKLNFRWTNIAVDNGKQTGWWLRILSNPSFTLAICSETCLPLKRSMKGVIRDGHYPTIDINMTFETKIFTLNGLFGSRESAQWIWKRNHKWFNSQRKNECRYSVFFTVACLMEKEFAFGPTQVRIRICRASSDNQKIGFLLLELLFAKIASDKRT